MRKFFTLAVVAASFFISAVPAHAEHDHRDAFWDTGDGDAAMWNNDSGTTENYCLSPDFLNEGLTTPQVDNLEESANLAFDQWKGNTAINRDIQTFASRICSGNTNFQDAYWNAATQKSLGESIREQFCESRPNDQKSSIQYENLGWLDTNIFALTWTCDTNENGLIDYVIVIVDVPNGQETFEWNWHPTTVGANKVDFRSVMTHEAGHGYGFGIHWGSSSDACVNTTAGHNAMCSDGWGFEDGWGAPADRTIESHDINETNAAGNY